MTQPLQILAGEELPSLNDARIYLASRVRVRTPLGAAEFLGVIYHHERETYDKRVQVALDCIELYRQFFPEEYSRSQSPAFSTRLEQEFYALVNDRLFPLLLSEEVDISTHILNEPNFFLPFIPMRGTQQHVWAGGCFDFRQIETVYKLAQVLSGFTGAGGRGWQALRHHFGLQGVPEPAPPTAGVGWTLFCYSCAVEETPIKHLPLAFHMISYRTGNPWLDLPQVGYVGFEWSAEQISRLHLAWRGAGEMNRQLGVLDAWLNEDPGPRIARAVELWNKAAQVEELSGQANVYLPPGTLGHFSFSEGALREVYGEDIPLIGDTARQLAALIPGADGALFAREAELLED
jgi:hypothetical protein